MQGAISLLSAVGLSKISERILSLIATVKSKLDPADFEFLSPDGSADHASFLTFRSRRVVSEKFVEALAKNDIVVSLRIDRANRGWIRVSPHFYNTFAEMERIAEVLNQL